MEKIIELFYQISKLNRCSLHKEEFLNYIQHFAKLHGYNCLIDEYSNVLCKKSENSKICLQSHYDMVCVNENLVEVLNDGDKLYAKESTLGADNGIGVAYMLYFMTQNRDFEFLFTSDEEIGLIGANHINFSLNSTYLINLDSEEEGDIFVGCAGGAEIYAKQKIQKIKNDDKYFYEIETIGFKGGHSGIDIDKGILNAIKESAKFIKNNQLNIIEFNGGERINSIPVSVKMVVSTNQKIDNIHEHFTIKQIEAIDFKLNNSLIDFINSFSNGVKSYNRTLDCVKSSINLSKINIDNDYINIALYARSLEKKELENMIFETKSLLEVLNFELFEIHSSLPWEFKESHLSTIALNQSKLLFKNPKLKVIHAGLECGILSNKFKNMEIISIGPNIFYPHSLSEYVEIKSIYKTFKFLKNLVDVAIPPQKYNGLKK
ncbi:MAG: M20/M25/M40 family metallo-hydrolase [Campylobacterales bacterium]|nr:M20/M25/M40 family metallo-hydrolase [Campylobacterales bacterium]